MILKQATSEHWYVLSQSTQLTWNNEYAVDSNSNSMPAYLCYVVETVSFPFLNGTFEWDQIKFLKNIIFVQLYLVYFTL